jgi:hypothetical protein
LHRNVAIDALARETECQPTNARLLDGQQGPSRSQGAEEPYGLLDTNWSGYAYKPLLDDLRSIM